MLFPKIQAFKYKYIFKPIFFRLNPEFVHDRVTSTGRILGAFRITRFITKKLLAFQDPSLEQILVGIHFKNPVGLTAGFDKNAQLLNILPSVGFGFAQVGSITGRPCPGNPKPRLWRLPKSKGLVVYYGLKNDGCKAISRRLRRKTFRIPISTSIAKTNDIKTCDTKSGIKDYANAFKAFSEIGDFFTINISCPNTFGGEPFAEPAKLHDLLTRLDAIQTTKPIFLKIAVDISHEELDALVEVAKKHRVHGFVLANLTKKYDSESIDQKEIQNITKGGVSGKPTQAPSNDLIGHLYKTAGKRFIIIGVGGIFTAEDAYEKIKQGASLVQLATGMIFEGPQVIGQINKGLVKLLKADGYTNISEAIGANNR